MVDHLTKRRVRQAAKDYMNGASLRAESAELSDKKLAGKFACNVTTIKRIRDHLRVTVLDQDDQHLIRQCMKEKDRLDAQLPSLSKVYLCRHYGISVEALDLELELAGWEDPRQKRKNQETVA